MAKNLNDLTDFGAVAAEDDDSILDYFLSTETVARIADGSRFLVLGRKGSGKTAIVRHFTEGTTSSRSKALNLRNYPWAIHAKRVDRGADPVDSYVASWRYLVSIEIAAWAVRETKGYHHDARKELEAFLNENYGGPSPKLTDIIRPKSLKVRGFKFMPQVLGNAIGSVDMERDKDDTEFGYELEALTNALVESSIKLIREMDLGEFYIHFDELDAGLQNLDDTRKAMLIGLVLALRSLRRDFARLEAPIKPVLYLRTDIWNDLIFSDKNKITQGQAVTIEWTSDTLKSLTEARLSAKLGQGTSWDDVIDSQAMRGSQPKWNYIIARTLKRPRDVIQFLNTALGIAKRRGPDVTVFENRDIYDSRPEYSAYLKKELDDEIVAHWPSWEEAFQALSRLAKETFDHESFETEYRNSKSDANEVSVADALKLMHRFSVIGYLTRRGYGGSGWIFMYEEPDKGWDSLATQFKVHPGLKEQAGLREDRQ